MTDRWLMGLFCKTELQALDKCLASAWKVHDDWFIMSCSCAIDRDWSRTTWYIDNDCRPSWAWVGLFCEQRLAKGIDMAACLVVDLDAYKLLLHSTKPSRGADIIKVTDTLVLFHELIVNSKPKNFHYSFEEKKWTFYMWVRTNTCS